MSTGRSEMTWIDQLIGQAQADLLAQRRQIETMLDEGTAFLFFDNAELTKEAVCFQGCFLEDNDSKDSLFDPVVLMRRREGW